MGRACGRSGCVCTHTEPCDKGWIEEEYDTPKLEAIPAEEMEPGGPMTRRAPGQTDRATRLRRCPTCSPPAQVPAKRYGPAEPDRQYADENTTPGWEGRRRADLE